MRHAAMSFSLSSFFFFIIIVKKFRSIECPDKILVDFLASIFAMLVCARINR